MATSIRALALATVLASLASTPAAWAQSAEPLQGARPRLAIAAEGVPDGFTQQLKEKLDATRRFEVDLPSGLAGRLRAERLGDGRPLTPPQARRASTLAAADYLLLAQGRQTNGMLRVGARLLDLRTGEASRELATFGDTASAPTLASTLARYVRRSVPVRALVQDTNDEGVVLDRGDTDGVLPNSGYRAFRHPQNMAPVPVGRVRISRLEPFSAVAEVEESTRGGLQAGDLLVEITAGQSMFED